MADVLTSYLTEKWFPGSFSATRSSSQRVTHQTEMSCQLDKLSPHIIQPPLVRFAITQVRLMPNHFSNIASSLLLTINSTGIHIRATYPSSFTFHPNTVTTGFQQPAVKSGDDVHQKAFNWEY
jgi:hypothetical protein